MQVDGRSLNNLTAHPFEPVLCSDLLANVLLHCCTAQGGDGSADPSSPVCGKPQLFIAPVQYKPSPTGWRYRGTGSRRPDSRQSQGTVDMDVRAPLSPRSQNLSPRLESPTKKPKTPTAYPKHAVASSSFSGYSSTTSTRSSSSSSSTTTTSTSSTSTSTSTTTTTGTWHPDV